MKTVSDRSFYIDSDEEDEENAPFKDDGCESDSSVSSMENQPQQSKHGSYITSWPQSYRQSIDLYSSVPSPSIGFLGTPTLSRMSGSFLSSSLTRRHTPEIMHQPLMAEAVEERPARERRSSQYLLPPIRRKSSVLKEEKPSKAGGHEMAMSRQSFPLDKLYSMVRYNDLGTAKMSSTAYAVELCTVGFVLLLLSSF